MVGLSAFIFIFENISRTYLWFLFQNKVPLKKLAWKLKHQINSQNKLLAITLNKIFLLHKFTLLKVNESTLASQKINTGWPEWIQFHWKNTNHYSREYAKTITWIKFIQTEVSWLHQAIWRSMFSLWRPGYPSYYEIKIIFS